MDYFAGLDVSVKDTSVCIVDDTGKIIRETKVASEPEALLTVLRSTAYQFKRIGLEAGPLSQWLFSALGEVGLPVICVETRHMRAALKAQINKTDRNDARGIAQIMRVGLYRPVHVKTLRSQKLRMLLTHRKLLQSKAIAVDNDLRGTLRNFGLKVGVVRAARFEARVKELVENLSDLAMLIDPLLVVRWTLREQLGILHRRLLAVVREDEVCRRLMTVPGVGPVVALTYRATVDVPARFRKSKSVGAVFGLTCAKYQSGEVDRSGKISRCGDEMMRVMLYEAAQSMLRSKKWSWLKAWAMQVARRLRYEKGHCRPGTTVGRDGARTNMSSIKYHFGGNEGLYRAVLKEIIHEITDLIGPLLQALRNGVAEANGNRDVLARLAREFAQNWCRLALGDPRTQKRIPPIVREVIQPSRHFKVIYEGFLGVLYDAVGELLAAVHGRAVVDEDLKIRAHIVMNVMGIHLHGVHSLAPYGMERLQSKSDRGDRARPFGRLRPLDRSGNKAGRQGAEADCATWLADKAGLNVCLGR